MENGRTRRWDVAAAMEQILVINVKATEWLDKEWVVFV